MTDRTAIAPWDRREYPGTFDLETSARMVGHYKWIEMRTFEVLGGWVSTVPDLDIKRLLGTHCYHHAWHAELWQSRLPELAELRADRLTVPANDELGGFVDALARPSQTLERLVGVYRVLVPRMIAAYAYHLNNCAAITDAPTMRSLGFVLADALEDWRTGEMAIQTLLGSPGGVARAAEHQRRLEELMVAAGGIAGPGSVGGSRA